MQRVLVDGFQLNLLQKVFMKGILYFKVAHVVSTSNPKFRKKQLRKLKAVERILDARKKQEQARNILSTTLGWPIT